MSHHRSRSLALLKSSANDNWSAPFCNCEFSETSRWNKTSEVTPKCKCGEDTSKRMDWIWKEEVDIGTIVIGPEVIFHPIYSQGTSIVCGNQPLQQRRHHYWEVKVLTPLSGTDMMFGIGTQHVDPYRYEFSFTSALGIDDQSWGYSYRGLAQHNGQLKYYGKKFSRGRIIGVYVDLFHGTLEFFLNRRSLGRVYSNIPTSGDVRIYPLVSSTSAKSHVRLINSASFENNLRFNCLKVVCKYPRLLEQINQIPGLKEAAQELWFLQNNEPNKTSLEFERKKLNLADVALLCGKQTNEANTNGLEINSEAQLYENLMKDEDHSGKTAKSSKTIRPDYHGSSDSTDEDEKMSVMISKEFFCNH